MASSAAYSGTAGRELPLWTVHAALAFVQVAYGGYHVLTKVALTGGVNPLVFCVWRDAIALLILGPTAFFWERRVRVPLTRYLAFLTFLLGCTGIFGNQLLFLLGLNATNPTAAAAIQPSIPIFTFILAIIFRLETVHWMRLDGIAKVGGVVTCVIGAVFMTTFQGAPRTGGDGDHALHHEKAHNIFLQLRSIFTVMMSADGSKWQFGVICLIGNCLVMATYFILQAPVLARYPTPVSVTALSYVWGVALITVTGALTVESADSWKLTGSQLVAAVYAGTVASALNYALLSWANTRVGPTMVALYVPLQPFASAILSRLFLGSVVNLGTVLGGGLILAGLYLVTWGRTEAERLHGTASKKRDLHAKGEDAQEEGHPLLVESNQIRGP